MGRKQAKKAPWNAHGSVPLGRVMVARDSAAMKGRRGRRSDGRATPSIAQQRRPSSFACGATLTSNNDLGPSQNLNCMSMSLPKRNYGTFVSCVRRNEQKMFVVRGVRWSPRRSVDADNPRFETRKLSSPLSVSIDAFLIECSKLRNTIHALLIILALLANERVSLPPKPIIYWATCRARGLPEWFHACRGFIVEALQCP